MSPTVIPISSKVDNKYSKSIIKIDLKWSFLPLFWFFKCLGFELDSSSSDSSDRLSPNTLKLKRYFRRISLFLLNITIFAGINVINALCIYEQVRDLFYLYGSWNGELKYPDNLDYTKLWNKFQIRKRPLLFLVVCNTVVVVSHFIFTTGTHFDFTMAYFTGNWRDLWNCFKKIERKVKLAITFYRKVRWACSIGIILMVLNLGGCFYSSINPYFYGRTQMRTIKDYMGWKSVPDWIEQLTTAICSLSYTFPAVVQTLFMILVVTIGLLFGQLRAHLEKLKNAANSDSNQAFQLVEKWRRFHILVCDLVEKINSSFGRVLLVFTFYSCLLIVNFVAISFDYEKTIAVNETFILGSMRSKYKNKWIINGIHAVSFFRVIIWMVIMLGAYHFMLRQANNLINNAPQFCPKAHPHQVHQNKLQNQWTNVMLHVSLTPNTISAMDVVDLSFTPVFSVVFGLAVTYSLLLRDVLGKAYMFSRV